MSLLNYNIRLVWEFPIQKQTELSEIIVVVS